MLEGKSGGKLGWRILAERWGKSEREREREKQYKIKNREEEKMKWKVDKKNENKSQQTRLGACHKIMLPMAPNYFARDKYTWLYKPNLI